MDISELTKNKQVMPEFTSELVLKFLVLELPADIKNYAINHITEVFLQTGENEIKFRRKAIIDKYSGEPTYEEYTSVLKRGFGKHRQVKVEGLDKEDFLAAIKRSPNAHVLSKTRCFAEVGENTLAKIDIYEGNLTGLCTAKIPFKSKWDANNFKKPSWLGEDVTSDKRFRSGEMAFKQSVPVMGE